MKTVAAIVLGMVTLTVQALEVPLRVQGGGYLVRFETAGVPPIGKTHTWTLRIVTTDGRPFLPDYLQVEGGMPSHGHGLPSQPQVTRQLEPGVFEVDGMLFNMRGDWELIVRFAGPRGTAVARGKFTLSPDTSAASVPGSGAGRWTGAQLALMQSLSLDSLEPAVDPTNRFAGDAHAQALGQRLFADPGLSGGGQRSCASCHIESKAFADGRELGLGSQPLARHTPGLIGVGHQAWFYWDGRRDSLWSQALTPIETMDEMDGTRVDVVRHLLSTPDYVAALARFADADALALDVATLPAHTGPFAGKAGAARWADLPKPVQQQVNALFVLVGKLIAAWEMTLEVPRGRFDAYVADVAQRGMSDALTTDERAGLALFLDNGKTQCLRCHNGPLLTNRGFHNIGTGPGANGFDFGRVLGLQASQFNPFNCTSAWSDAPDSGCEHVRFAVRQQPTSAYGAFKVPTLRQLTRTAPYLHDGRFSTLEQVVEYYIKPAEQTETGHELVPIELTADEVAQLAAFLRTL